MYSSKSHLWMQSIILKLPNQKSPSVLLGFFFLFEVHLSFSRWKLLNFQSKRIL